MKNVNLNKTGKLDNKNKQQLSNRAFDIKLIENQHFECRKSLFLNTSIILLYYY